MTVDIVVRVNELGEHVTEGVLSSEANANRLRLDTLSSYVDESAPECVDVLIGPYELDAGYEYLGPVGER